jgi:hypothetical protein
MLQLSVPSSQPGMATPTLLRHRVGAEAGIIDAIAEPQVDLIVWQRSLPPSVTHSLETWLTDAEMNVDRVLPAHASELDELVAPVRAPALRQFLRDDMQRLLAQFVRITGTRRVRVVLCTKRTNSCRKFHTDNVRLRLITTYAGPGTEWPLEHAVDRAAMGLPCACPDEANHEIVRDPSAIQQTRAGDVLLLKGERWPDAGGAVHRSPPIEGTGQNRLVLSLTTVESGA